MFTTVSLHLQENNLKIIFCQQSTGDIDDPGDKNVQHEQICISVVFRNTKLFSAILCFVKDVGTKQCVLPAAERWATEI